MNQSAKHEIRNILTKDHRTIESLFEKYKYTSKYAEMENIAESIASALKSHLELEERVIYPRIRNVPKGDKLVNDVLKDHAGVRLAIDELRRLFADLDNSEFNKKISELKNHFDHHITLSEQEVIPKIELSDIDLTQMATEMNECKEDPKSLHKPAACLPRHRFQPETASFKNTDTAGNDSNAFPKKNQ